MQNAQQQTNKQYCSTLDFCQLTIIITIVNIQNNTLSIVNIQNNILIIVNKDEVKHG